MKQANYSHKFLKRRKLLLVLPLLTIPFITMAFWALGGGEAEVENAEKVTVGKGLNPDLPEPQLKDEKGYNKMSFYEQAALDSARRQELVKNDPYFSKYADGSINNLDHLDTTDGLGTNIRKSSQLVTSPYGERNVDPNEQKVYAKLSELNDALNKTTSKSNATSIGGSKHKAPATFERDVPVEYETTTEDIVDGNDEELDQLNSMLDKIQEIQHPDLVKQKLKESSLQHKRQVYPVNNVFNEDVVSLLGGPKEQGKLRNDSAKQQHNSSEGFLSETRSEYNYENQQENAIAAIIHETQSLLTGSTVKIRVLNDVMINGMMIPHGSFVFGIASLQEERLNVDVTSIRFKNSVLPVSLSVYDVDGLQGIYIPGTITRDVSKQSAEQAIQSLATSSLNPSLAAQAATAGIEAAKSLMTRKVKLIKVEVKAGYKILLVNNSADNF